jgi:hypothetical protein
LAAADDMVERLQRGEPLTAVAGDFEVKTAGLVGRTVAGVPPEALQLAFSMPRPTADVPRADRAATDSGGAVVVALTQVVDGDPSTSDQAEREAEARLLADTLSRSAYQSLLDDLESRADIEREALPPDTPQ